MTKIIIVVAALVFAGVVLSGGEDESPAPATDAPPAAAAAETEAAEPPATEPESRCVPVSQPKLDAIASGLTVTGGGALRDAWAVRSSDFEKVWFVSAEIDGSGIEGDGDVGTWATNEISSEAGLIYSVGGIANEFSDWGDGGATDAGFSLSDDGAGESAECARSK